MITLLTIVVLGVEIAAVIAALSRWRARAERGPVPGWVLASAVLVVVAPMVGVFATAIAIGWAFTAVESVAPEAKARFLGDGISSAMNLTAIAMLVPLLSSVGVLVWYARTRPGAESEN